MLTQSTSLSIPAIDEIRIHLIRIGLDQPTLARRLGVTKQYLNQILHGKRKAPHIRNRLVVEFEFPEYLLENSPSKDLAA